MFRYDPERITDIFSLEIKSYHMANAKCKKYILNYFYSNYVNGKYKSYIVICTNYSINLVQISPLPSFLPHYCDM